MTTQGWVYLAVGVLLWRVFAGAIYRDHYTPGGDRGDPIFFGLLGGTVAAVFWPVTVVVAVIVLACQRWPDAMFRLAFHTPSRERKQHHLDRLHRRSRDLERELGI